MIEPRHSVEGCSRSPIIRWFGMLCFWGYPDDVILNGYIYVGSFRFNKIAELFDAWVIRIHTKAACIVNNDDMPSIRGIKNMLKFFKDGIILVTLRCFSC
jgi:hypothetical protein